MRAPTLTFNRARELRRDMSLPEVVLWECLRARRLEGLRFRRQHPMGRYMLDFYCPAARLAIEVDGAHHDHPAQIYRDGVRDDWLAVEGIRVMRVAAPDILDDRALEGTLAMIVHAAAGGEVHGVRPPPPPSAVPLPRKRGRIKAADGRTLGSSSADESRQRLVEIPLTASEGLEGANDQEEAHD